MLWPWELAYGYGVIVSRKTGKQPDQLVVPGPRIRLYLDTDILTRMCRGKYCGYSFENYGYPCYCYGYPTIKNDLKCAWIKKEVTLHVKLSLDRAKHFLYFFLCIFPVFNLICFSINTYTLSPFFPNTTSYSVSSAFCFGDSREFRPISNTQYDRVKVEIHRFRID